MTYKEHVIFIDVRRDAGDCFWLPLASVCWNEEGKKQVVSIKGRPQDRFVHAAEAENSAFQIAREWVDNRLRNRHPVKIPSSKQSLRVIAYLNRGASDT